MKVTDEIIKSRLEKLERLKEEGIDPFGGRYEVNSNSQEIKEHFKEGEEKTVKIGGRIIFLRQHGKACFANIKDAKGEIQVYAKYDLLGEKNYRFFTKLDIGDFIGVSGKVFRTLKGEITISVEEFTFLTKSLHPLPEKYHGLQDVELRYRQRYLDLMVNKEVTNVFILRSKIIHKIREFLNKEDFLEVETPMMHPIAGGALARPFETYHHALNMKLFLRIAPELYLKKLIIGGLNKVYELNRCFRNEGISIKHNPEFTMIEIYQALADYLSMMDLTERLIKFVALETLGSLKLSYQGQPINLEEPWRRMTLLEAVKKYTGEDLTSLDKVKELALKLQVEFQEEENEGEVLDHIFGKYVEPNLIAPTFIMDYPTVVSPLAKKKKDPLWVERFELYMAGQELGNAYSELNDPFEQRERFKAQKKEKMDEDFLQALEYGLPPTGGLGIGIDRLVMILADVSSIKEVILFPQLRPTED
ncbi:lysine--tRNA ligase [bacterium]|nr:lysine--tRNA ligase [bacterium]MBU0899694.1 lysine--tRNA ligase [bacterium]MBU1152651.1 lysine--tRNA ligase [bacterium]MBU2600425.1 lysine--tRNA ligase [bacterium]